MLNITERITSAEKIDDYCELPFDLRQKSRIRVTLKSGLEAALLLDRGIILRGGDLLKAENGHVIQMIAAPQAVMHVEAQTPQLLMCGAYHLGNRHVPLQVGNGWLRLEQDHVLKEMLLGLGLKVTEQQAPFEPEAGAYGGGHRHGHEDDTVNIRQPARLKHHA